MGTDWADWQTPALGTKINSILHVLDRLICTSSEEALTMEFMATVRGRLAKGQLVSKTSFIQASQTPVSCLMLLAFELLRQNILHGGGERGRGDRLGCYSVLSFWKNPPKLKVMAGPLRPNSNLASRRTPVYQKFRRRLFSQYFQLWKLHTHSMFTYSKKFLMMYNQYTFSSPD